MPRASNSGRQRGWPDNHHPDARIQSLLAKVNASETAFDVCRLAAEVLGGGGIMYEHPVEKYLRDAASFLHSDGTNQLCLLRAVRALAGRGEGSVYGF